jgi:O-antigen/teichoic acid export membrane protein
MNGPKEFSRHVLTMMTGNAIAQAIPLLASPLLTRLYSPTEFGVLSAIIAAGGMLSVLFTLRYELAVVLPRAESDAASLAALALACSIAWGVATVLLLLLFPVIAATLFARASDYVLAIPLLAIAIGCSQILSFAANRERRYRTIASGSVLQQMSAAVISIALGWLGAPLNGLIVGRLSGYVIAVAYYINRLADILKTWAGLVSSRRVIENASTYRQFPAFNVPYSFIGNFSREFLVLALTAMHQTEAAGLYGLARSALTAPIGFLSASLSQVFYKEAAVSIGTPEFKQLTLKFLRYLAAGLAPFFVLGWFWAPEVFKIVFGAQWREAGVYASALMPIGYLSLFTSWPERVFEVRGKQRLSLTIQATFDAVTVAVVGFALLRGMPPLVAIYWYVAIQCFYHLTYLAAVFRLSGFGFSGFARFAGLGILVIIVSTVLQLAPRQIPTGELGQFMISLLVAAITSLLLLLPCRRLARNDAGASA